MMKRYCTVKAWLKILLSSVLSFLIFAAGCFAIVKYNGFELVELRFYEPRVISNVEEKLKTVSDEFDGFYADTMFSLSNFAAQESTKSYFAKSASDAAVKSRTDSLGLLQEQIPGLQVRVVQNDGKHIHFSTFKNDILKQEGSLTSYKPYEDAVTVPFDSISASNSPRLTFSSAAGMFVFSLPLKDSANDISGTIVFYVPVEDFTKVLVSKNVITMNQYGILVAPEQYSSSENSGIVFGFPSVGQELVAKEIVSAWSENFETVTQIVAKEDGEEKLTLITGKTSSHVLAGWVCNESDFVFSREEKALLLVVLFIILYLLIFFLFNLKHEPVAVIKKRMQKFGNAILFKYQNKNWSDISRELLGRRQDSYEEIKKSLGKLAVNHAEQVQFYFDRCWSEIILTLGGDSASVATSVPSATPSATPVKEKVKPPLPDAVAPLPVSEVSDAEELDEVEEVSEAEELDEVEEVSEAEELDEVEEVSDAEELDEVEEVSDAEELDEVEEVSDAEELDEVEEVSEAEELDEVEEVSEAEELDEVEEVSDAEELDEVEEVSEAEDAESIEEDDGLPAASLLRTPGAEEDIVSIDSLVEQVPDENESSSDAYDSAVTRVASDPMFKEELGFEEIKPRPHFLPTAEQKQFAESFSVAELDFSNLDSEVEDSTVASPYQHKADLLVEELVGRNSEPGTQPAFASKSLTKTSVVKAETLESVNKSVQNSVSHRKGLLGHAMLLKKEMETPQQAIIEQDDGVFVIPEGLSTRSVKQNLEFKKLVDSVLGN